MRPKDWSGSRGTSCPTLEQDEDVWSVTLLFRIVIVGELMNN